MHSTQTKSVPFSEAALAASRNRVAQFERDLNTMATALAQREGDDVVSARHVEHAAHTLMSSHSHAVAKADFGAATIIAGAGISGGIALLSTTVNESVACWLCAGLTLVGLVAMAAKRPRRP